MRALCLSLLLGLPACMIIGDPMLPGDSDGDGDPSTSGPDATTTGETTSGPDATTTGETTTGTEATTTTTTDAQPTTTAGTTEGSACEGLDEIACATTEGCRVVLGAPLEFPGCNPFHAFLGCIEQTDCGLMPTTVCRPNSLEVYVLDDTCIPPDLEACDSALPACGDGCFALDEAACAMDPNCSPQFGAPHVEQDMMICADVANPQFLACDKLHDPCPPVVVTVCPMGQPDVAFDVASGCVPPGFETCMDGPVPECP